MSITKLPGSAIKANTITTTQLQTTVVNQITAGGGPRVTSLIYPGNDTAGNTAGGQTVYINGSGFETNNAIYINGNAVPSKAFISASNLSFTTPALSAGIYPVYVINTDNGATAIFIPGYVSSAEPTWVTGATLASLEATSAWNIQLSATGDGAITYALAGGSSLPAGITLAANGLISGTLSSPPAEETQYSFTVIASDAQNQDASRAFTVTASVGEGVLFANNVLLIHADGTNNGNNHSFLDSSNNNFTITRNGNATQGSFSPFSQTGWSGYFDGSGDYLTAPNNAALEFGTGDFTVECWVNSFDKGSNKVIAYLYNSPTNYHGWQLRIDSGGNGYATITVFGGSSPLETNVTGTSNICDGKWHHIAAVRSGTTLSIFVDGVREATTTNSYNITSTATFHIGRDAALTTRDWGGYISNLRIIKGSSPYDATSSTLTPPSAPLAPIANTSLLALQSNRLIDDGPNNFTLTRNGDTSIQAFSPFAPSAAYSTANVGGSVYLDGTDDYLRITDNAAFDFGSGNFTIECWAYTELFASQYNVLVCQWGSSTAWIFRIQSSLIGLYANIGGTQNYTASVTNTTGQWDHFAVTRSGTTLTFYKNGVSVGTTTISGTINNATDNISIGVLTDFNPTTIHKGYISGLRVIKGSAVAPTITAPPTNVANTSLLLNFTNAQIFDQTAKNVLETVGDAKVSTSVYKYGTGSIAFDGTGDYLISPSSRLLSFGSSDFTIESWVRVTAHTNADGCICLNWTGTWSANNWSLHSDHGSANEKFSFWVYNYASGSPILTSTTTVATGTWYHVAVTRSGNTWRLFVNGTVEATQTSSVAMDSGTTWPLYISGALSVQNLNGHIDDLRITKGYARYTSNFTPPTSALRDK